MPMTLLSAAVTGRELKGILRASSSRLSSRTLTTALVMMALTGSPGALPSLTAPTMSAVVRMPHIAPPLSITGAASILYLRKRRAAFLMVSSALSRGTSGVM
jgi:hypothetical protein